MRFLRLLLAFEMMSVFAMAQTGAGQGGGAGAVAGEQRAPARAGIQSTTNLMGLMEMSVAGFADGSDIPIRYSQAVHPTGTPSSPAITWTNVPAGTVSFVLYLHNPDASINKTTQDQPHWLVWNIPGAATGLPETEPNGAQLPNGAYQDSAAGLYYWAPGSQAQVPKRHFVFELYALDTTLDIQPDTDGFATRTSVLKAMDGHVLGKSVYVGLFHRPKPKKGNRVGIFGQSGLFEVVAVDPLKLTADLKAMDGQGHATRTVPWTSINFQPAASH